MIRYTDEKTVLRRGINEAVKNTPLAGSPFLVWFYCQLPSDYVMLIDNPNNSMEAMEHGARPVWISKEILPGKGSSFSSAPALVETGAGV